MSNKKEPTKEQQRIIDDDGNVAVIANPGSGKTFTIVEKIKNALGDKVKDVVLSKRLSESPSCIVVDENDPSLQMERMMKAMGQPTFGGGVKPILEVNGDHALVGKVKDTDDAAYIEDVANVLLDQALLVGGGEIADPADFVKRMNRLLTK